MLVLTRKIGERIVIDGSIVVTVLDATHGRVRLGIDAPAEYPITRPELDRRPRLQSAGPAKRTLERR